MLSRRAVLGASAGLVVPATSIGAAAVPGVGEDYDCDEQVEINTVVSGDEVVETENVSKAWYDNLEHVRSVRAEFDEEYPLQETEWLRSVGITAADAEVCGQSQMAISVGVNDTATAEAELGDTFRDVPLVIREQGEVHPAGGSGSTAAMEQDANGSEGGSEGEEGGAEDGNADDREDEPTDDALPGFGLLAGATGLAGAAIALHRRHRAASTTETDS